MTERLQAGRTAEQSETAILAARANSEERFRHLVESIQDYAILMLDPDGLVTTWNKGAESINGYRSDEIIGRNYSQLYPQEDVLQGRPEHELAVAVAEGRFEQEGWRIRKSGTLFWADVAITPMYDRGGELSGFSEVVRDITERKDAQKLWRRWRAGTAGYWKRLPMRWSW
jgi:PAS domain S-box-containing protein